MLKLIEVVPRRSDLTHSQFIEHLSTTHLEVVDRVPEFRNRVRNYMQNHLFVDPNELATINGIPICLNGDAIIEVWWDGIADILGAFQEPRYLEIIRPDELSFGDVPGAWGVTTNDIDVMKRDGFSGRIKCFLFFKRRDGISHSDFLCLWREARDGRLMPARAFRNRVRGFVENLVGQDPAESLPGMKAFDLVAEFWFDSLQDVAEFTADPDVIASTVGASAAYTNRAQTLVYVAEEQPAAAEWLRRGRPAA
jgi:hypothetical protein